MDIIGHNESAVEVEHEGRLFHCRYSFDADGYAFLVHYNGYCSDTSDLLCEISGDDEARLRSYSTKLHNSINLDTVKLI